MKRFLLTTFVLLALSSCDVYNHIVEINDPYKGIKGLRLDQRPYAISAEKIAAVFGTKQIYPFTSSFQLEETGNSRPKIFADFELKSPVGVDQLDTVLYFNLDGEKIKLTASEYKKKDVQNYSTTETDQKKKSDQNDKSEEAGSNTVNVTTENSSYQIMSLRFIVPENLWVSIAATEKIQYRLYKGKEGIDIKPNLEETAKLKEFFQRACLRRVKAFPAIPKTPEGLKKW